MRKHRKFVEKLLLLPRRQSGGRGNNNKIQKRDRVRQIREANNSQLCAVCEIVKNLLRNPTLGIELDPTQRNLLRRNRRQLERLISQRSSSDEKRKILQRGGGFLLPLIAALAAPVLSKIFGSE